MNDFKEALNSDATQTEPSKRRYTSPRLEAFGRIIDITRSASCNVQSDSESVTTCTPGNMAMQEVGSDLNVKENVVRIGTHPLGIGLYLFDYKPEFQGYWGHDRQFGVMAQEVEPILPEAVSVHENGYKMVNYSLLGISRISH